MLRKQAYACPPLLSLLLQSHVAALVPDRLDPSSPGSTPGKASHVPHVGVVGSQPFDPKQRQTVRAYCTGRGRRQQPPRGRELLAWGASWAPPNVCLLVCHDLADVRLPLLAAVGWLRAAAWHRGTQLPQPIWTRCQGRATGGRRGLCLTARRPESQSCFGAWCTTPGNKIIGLLSSP